MRYANKDLSRLKYIECILSQARHAGYPLDTRIEYLLKSSRMLDAFITERFGKIYNKSITTPWKKDNSGTDAFSLMIKCQTDIRRIRMQQYSLLNHSFVRLLAGKGMLIENEPEKLPAGYGNILSLDQLQKTDKYELEEKSIYAAVQCENSAGSCIEYYRLPDEGRYLKAEHDQYFLTDAVYRLMLVEKYPEAALIRILRSRKKTAERGYIYLETPSGTDKTFLNHILSDLGISKDLVCSVRGPVDLSFMGQIQDLCRQNGFSKNDSCDKASGQAVIQGKTEGIFKGSFEELLIRTVGQLENCRLMLLLPDGHDLSLCSHLLQKLSDHKADVSLYKNSFSDEELQTIRKFGYGPEQILLSGNSELIAYAAAYSAGRMQEQVIIELNPYDPQCTDTAMMLKSSDIILCDEIRHYFDFVSGNGPMGQCSKFAVSPYHSRAVLMSEIAGVTRKVSSGSRNSIFIKSSAMSDREMAEMISDAAETGINVGLFPEGQCIMLPENKIPGLHISVSFDLSRSWKDVSIFCFISRKEQSVYAGTLKLTGKSLERKNHFMVKVTDPEVIRYIVKTLQKAYSGKAGIYDLTPEGIYIKK